MSSQDNYDCNVLLKPLVKQDGPVYDYIFT